MTAVAPSTSSMRASTMPSINYLTTWASASLHDFHAHSIYLVGKT